MDTLQKTLLELKETLEKIGTKASSPNVLPSPTGFKPPKPPKIDISITEPKTSPLVPTSTKNPIKQAQQIQDPGAKATALSIAKEKLKLNKNGQWSLEKQFPVPNSP